MGDRAGQQLGNYRLVRLLGQGGFADVYLGEHVYLGVLAAVKIFHYRLIEDEHEQFYREERTLARLIHPLIVRILEFGVEGTTPYLVMDYAPNGSLRQRHPRGSLLPLSTIITYVRQIADALQYAHDQKVIHRDVKPENMLLGRRDEVLISDFGIAFPAQISGDQKIQDAVGTVAYMAPEQLQGKPRTASDQYSLGIVVYEWLTGNLPFRGSFTAIASQQLFAPPPALHEKAPIIPPGVEQVVLTALAKDPQKRFASVLAFANALEQASAIANSYFPSTLPNQSQSYTFNPSSSPNLPSSIQLPTPTYGQTASSFTPIPAPQVNASSLPPLPAEKSSLIEPSAVPSLPVPASAKRRTSRRAFIVGLVGLAGVAAAEITANGGLQKLFQRPPKPSPTSATPLLNNYTYHDIAEVNTVAWSPNGGYIAFGDKDNKVVVLNASNGISVLIYLGHLNWVFAVAWSPNSQRIASAGADDTVHVWNAFNGDPIFTYTGHKAAVQSVAWSPDGTRIISGSGDKTVHVWGATDGVPILAYNHNDAVLAVAWSPNGQFIASASADQTVQVWNVITRTHLLTYQGHSSQVNTITWSPDSQRIASGSSDHTVRVWDVATGGQKFAFVYRGHSDQVRSVAWSPDNSFIASGSADDTAQVWNFTGNLFTYRRHTNWVLSVACSPDSTHIASASADSTVQVWQPFR